MLEGTTAFVTGASQGIGREIASTLADRGATVALAARSDGIYQVSEEIGDRAHPVETDVTDTESVRRSIEETAETFGGLDCLVNNAGIAGPTARIERVEEEEWNRTLDVNVSGAYRTVKHAGPHLRESDRGRIINISSVSGKRPLQSRTPYAASKMAMIGLTRTLAFEFGDDGVTANTICPGATKGPRLDTVIQSQAEETGQSFEETKRKMFLDEMPLNSMVEAADVASMVAYLASDEADHITGQDINVDAGVAWY